VNTLVAVCIAIVAVCTTVIVVCVVGMSR